MHELVDTPSPGSVVVQEERRPGERVRVAVVASVRLYREGLAQCLGATMEVVAVTGDRTATMDEVRRHAPEVLLLDLSMEGGLALLQTLGVEAPETRVVVFAVDEAQEREVLACAEAGAAGWVGRNSTAEELVGAVQRAARGELLISPRTAALLTSRVAALARDRQGAGPTVPAARLTPRECEIGELLGQGMSNKHIAMSLGMRLPTVKNHVHSILDKLEVSSRAEAAARLRRLGVSIDVVPTD